MRKEPGLKRLLRAQLFAEEHHLKEPPARHDAAHHGHDHKRKEAALDLGRAQDGALAPDRKIARTDHSKAAAHRDARDARDDGFSKLAEAKQEIREAALQRKLAFAAAAELLEIGAGRKSVARARKHDDPHRLIITRVIKRIKQLIDDDGPERVLPCRLIQRDGADG